MQQLFGVGEMQMCDMQLIAGPVGVREAAGQRVLSEDRRGRQRVGGVWHWTCSSLVGIAQQPQPLGNGDLGADDPSGHPEFAMDLPQRTSVTLGDGARHERFAAQPSFF